MERQQRLDLAGSDDDHPAPWVADVRAFTHAARHTLAASTAASPRRGALIDFRASVIPSTYRRSERLPAAALACGLIRHEIGKGDAGSAYIFEVALLFRLRRFFQDADGQVRSSSRISRHAPTAEELAHSRLRTAPATRI